LRETNMSCLYFAVIGDPIQHSLSPEIHNLFAKQTGRDLQYEKFQVNSEDFEKTVKDFFDSSGHGLNITQPYKERAYNLSDVKTARCELAKSANTLWKKDGKIHADNTDGVGLINDLQRHIDIKDKNILLLGAGGAARGVLGPLIDASTKNITIINRTYEKALELQKDFLKKPLISNEKEVKPEYEIIINATSASLLGKMQLLPDEVISNATFCYDLAYNRLKTTSFTNKARELGVNATDGIGMLVEQAAFSFEIWHGVMPKANPVIDSLTGN
jgi:shikimate dehydrogenase